MAKPSAKAPKTLAANATPGFVTVACRLPQGLVIPLPDGAEIKLHGAATPYAVAGHGMTQIREDIWTGVQVLYSEARWLTNGAVFALPNPESAAAKAQERKDVDAGFDPIDPSKPNAGLGIGVQIQPEGSPDPAAR